MGNETLNVTVDTLGNIIRYYCFKAMANNVNLLNLFVPYAYELMYDCSPDSSQSISDGIEVIEESILVKMQKKYLSSPAMCIHPQPLWIASIDSRPEDIHIPGIECTYFNVSSEMNKCCAVIQGNLTLTNLSSVEQHMDEILLAVSTALIDSDGSAGYVVDYLGANLESSQAPGADNLGAAVNTDMPQQLTPTDSKFTGLGVFFLIFVVLSACGTLTFVILRHRKMNQFMVGLEAHNCLEAGDDDEEEEWIEPRRVPSREQADANLLSDDNSLDFYIRSIAAQPFGGPGEASPDRKVDSIDRFESAYCFEPLTIPQTERQQQTTALLTSSDHSVRHAARIRQQSYSISGISAVPAHLQEVEISDASEIDSWAQTEGTIGSLDDRDPQDSGN